METTQSTKNQVGADNLDSYFRFRRALRKADQTALEGLFEAAKGHAALAEYAPQATPLEVMLLSMLLEEYKVLQVVKQQFDTLRQTLAFNQPKTENKLSPEDTIPGSVDPGYGFEDVPESALHDYFNPAPKKKT